MLQILHSLPFFANVPESLFERVLAAGQLIMYTAGELHTARSESESGLTAPLAEAA